MPSSHVSGSLSAVLRATLLVSLMASACVDPEEAPARQATDSATKRVIAHRGASAYAPEHTIAAYELAIAQGADFVEQDLVATRDGVLICLHDETLERTTDVETVFPDRFVLDDEGERRWLASELTLEEIKRLDAGRWFDESFAGARIATWDEAVAIVGDRAGLYPELKAPARHLSRGVDLVALFAQSLDAHGLAGGRRLPDGRPAVIVQSFDEAAIRALATRLPDVPRTLLVGNRRAAERWFAGPEALQEIATFATGIGPSKSLIDEAPNVVAWAHDAGLTVTPYTFRASDPGRFADVAAEMSFFLNTLGVDALFTDNPDRFPR